MISRGLRRPDNSVKPPRGSENQITRREGLNVAFEDPAGQDPLSGF